MSPIFRLKYANFRPGRKVDENLMSNFNGNLGYQGTRFLSDVHSLIVCRWKKQTTDMGNMGNITIFCHIEFNSCSIIHFVLFSRFVFLSVLFARPSSENFGKRSSTGTIAMFK